MPARIFCLRARVFVGLLIIGGLAACTSSSPKSTTVGSGSAAPFDTAPAGVSLPCDEAIGKVVAPPDDYEVVLDAVALPTADSAPQALQAGPGGDDDAPDGWLFAKTGLLVRGTRASSIDVASSTVGRLLIGWGGPANPAEHLTVAQCGRDDQWLAFAGGFWVATAGCVAIDITVGGDVRRVMIGVGAPCDGQQPPA